MIRFHCFAGNFKEFKRIPLETFLNCENHYGVNRQITMLANLSQTCPPFGTPEDYNTTQGRVYLTWDKLLQSAKENLLNIDYFGLTEHQELSAELFEWTFNLRFNTTFKQRAKTTASGVILSDVLQKKVDILTQHERELYRFAEALFFKRINFMKRQNGYSM